MWFVVFGVFIVVFLCGLCLDFVGVRLIVWLFGMMIVLVLF